MHGFSFPRQRVNYWRKVPNAFSTAIEQFTPQMFVVCMGTGITSVLMHNNPYQFNGLGIISVVVFVIDLILFASITTAFIARWICYRESTAKMFETDVEQTTYLSTTAIASATLVEVVSINLGSTWDRWEVVSFALWWAVVALAVISSITTYWLLIRDEEVHTDSLSPTLLYPTTGVVATAAAGSVVISYTTLSVQLSMPILVVSYILMGAGFFLSLLTITAYFIRLLSNQTPPAKKVAAQFVPVAALSNASYAVAQLGYVAGPKRRLLEAYGSGPVADVANAFYGAGVVLELIIFGFASFWLLLSLVAFARDINKTHFNLNHWSAAYPLGVYGVACSQLTIDFDSRAFAVITTIITIAQFIYWLLLVIYTVPSVFSGEMFLAEIVEKPEEEKRNRESEDELLNGSQTRESRQGEESSPAAEQV